MHPVAATESRDWMDALDRRGGQAKRRYCGNHPLLRARAYCAAAGPLRIRSPALRSGRDHAVALRQAMPRPRSFDRGYQDTSRLLRRGWNACSDVQAISERHLDEIRSRIADLRRLASALEALIAPCGRGQTQCPDRKRVV